MLRITEVSRTASTLTFKLEGKVLAPWLDELRSVCEQRPNQPVQVCLDVGAVTFMDAEGAALMRELIQQGIAVTQCSAFIATLLQAERK
jgi:hypothetical protein